MAYLRLLANPDDDTAFLRIVNTPRREIGPSTLEKLVGLCRRAQDLACSACCDELGLEQQLSGKAAAAPARVHRLDRRN